MTHQKQKCCEECRINKLIHTCQPDPNGFSACGCCSYKSVCSDSTCPCHQPPHTESEWEKGREHEEWCDKVVRTSCDCGAHQKEDLNIRKETIKEVVEMVETLLQNSYRDGRVELICKNIKDLIGKLKEQKGVGFGKEVS